MPTACDLRYRPTDPTDRPIKTNAPCRVKYIIADQLAVEAKQEDESEYEGGGGASYNGGPESSGDGAATGTEESKA